MIEQLTTETLQFINGSQANALDQKTQLDAVVAQDVDVEAIVRRAARQQLVKQRSGTIRPRANAGLDADGQRLLIGDVPGFKPGHPVSAVTRGSE